MKEKIIKAIGIIVVLTVVGGFILIRLDLNKTGQEMLKKPIIYMYPEKDGTEVTYKSEVSSEFLCTYPTYDDKDGWRVIANKDGTLTVDDRKYNYLFWESESNVFRENICLSEGWIIESKNVVPFLEEKLKFLNLTDKEADDFISYWLPEMIVKPYVYIRFVNDEFKDYVNPKITPTPDSYISVFMAFEPLDEKAKNCWKIKEQQLIPVERKGFTVVEWGGLNLNPAR